MLTIRCMDNCLAWLDLYLCSFFSYQLRWILMKKKIKQGYISEKNVFLLNGIFDFIIISRCICHGSIFSIMKHELEAFWRTEETKCNWLKRSLVRSLYMAFVAGGGGVNTAVLISRYPHQNWFIYSLSLSLLDKMFKICIKDDILEINIRKHVINLSIYLHS